jgi:hypothetical protein
MQFLILKLTYAHNCSIMVFGHKTIIITDVKYICLFRLWPIHTPNNRTIKGVREHDR